MHIALGCEILFRIGILISFVINLSAYYKDQDLVADRLVRLFNINSMVLFVAYLGMMLKVAHLMETQIEKDVVLDFLAIPGMVGALLYNFASVQSIMESGKTSKILFNKYIILPWVMLLCSFLVYAIFSAILASGH